MSDLADKIDGLQIKDDLFKDVKYFVTGNLNPKVCVAARAKVTIHRLYVCSVMY